MALKAMSPEEAEAQYQQDKGHELELWAAVADAVNQMQRDLPRDSAGNVSNVLKTDLGKIWSNCSRLIALYRRDQREAKGQARAQARVAPSSRRNVASSRLPSTVMGELCERESNDFDR